jgi:hypothetical protein
MKFLKHVPLHPFIIGMFPVVSLFAHNLSQLEPGAPWRSLAIVLGGTAIVFVLLRWVLGDWNEAGFITSYVSVLFFVYGPIKNVLLLNNIHIASINLGAGTYFLPLWVLVLALGIWLIVRKIPRGETSLLIFNCIALSTLILPLISITSHAISHHNSSTSNQPNTLVKQGSTTTLPDVYYIILDGHGRSDTIEREFGYDNSAFLEALRKQGFYVAGCSTSNYSNTIMSLSSSLNMNYLPVLGKGFVAGNQDDSEAVNLIKNNAVRQYFHQFGYAFVSFQSKFPFLNLTNSDVYIPFPDQKGYIQPFELLLIQQTPGIYILDEIEKIAGSQFKDANREQYDHTLFALDELARIPTSVQGPKFVYAHLMIPHVPYIFGPIGEYTGDEDLSDMPGYPNQVQYIDSRMPKIVQEIISRSKTPPVIIIQGDHGFYETGGVQKRMPILNAYYLPGTDSNKLLYPTITPVNTFRVVLNTYFNGKFDLLPDRNYYSPDKYDIYNVTYYENQSIECRPK